MSLVLLCPGQGAQHAQMFALVQQHPAVQSLFDQGEALLGTSLATAAASPQRYQNQRAQPLVCAAALAHWLALRDALPAPVLVAGYSAGEVAAHAIAGSIEPGDCLPLARTRAALMDAAAPADSGLSAVLGLGPAQIQALCSTHNVHVAIVNGEDHVVLGGLRSALDAACTEASAAGARVVALPVCVPAHTPLLASAAHDLAAYLAGMPLRLPALTVLAGIDGRAVVSISQLINSLAAQVAQTVQWQQVMQQAVERGGRVFLQLGPGAALSQMARQLHPQLQSRAVEDFHTLEGVVEWVQQACARA